MPEIIRYYCPEGHWLGQTASANEDPPVSCYCEGCDLTYGRHDFDEQVVDISGEERTFQPITISDLEALKISHYEFGNPHYSCPKSEAYYEVSGANYPCNCGADEHNQKVDALIEKINGYKRICRKPA